jgi:Leucine-rich repeat (LRR) protein
MTWLRTKAFCGCLVLLALSACNREGQQQPDPAPPRRVTVRPAYQGLDAATVAAYEKLGATYGTMRTGNVPFNVPFRPGLAQAETYNFQFRAGRNPAEKGLPGFRFRSFPQAKLPEVAAPFGLDLDVHSSGVAEARLRELGGLPNLVALNLYDAQDAGLKELAGCKNLSALSLFDARRVTDAGLKELAGCKNLNTLNLYDARRVTDAGLKALAGCKNLSELNLTQARVTDRGLKELASLPNLTTFFLLNQFFPDVTTAGLKELAGCKNLAELSLSLGNSPVSPVSLKELAGFKSLAKLDLYWPPIDATLIGLADLNILVTLHLEDQQITDDCLHVLRGMGLLHTLSVAQGKDGSRPRSAEEVISLDLSRADQVTAVGLKALAGLKNLTTLYLYGAPLPNEAKPAGRAYGLPFSGLRDEGLRVLREIGLLHAVSYATGKGGARPRSAAEVISLDLTAGHTWGLTDAGLKELAGLKNLTSLNLAGLNVTGAGLKELADLKILTTLDLSGTQVTDAGLKGLAGLTSLQSLDLYKTKVTDAGLKELAGLKNLTSLKLNGYQVTDAWLKELAALKNLTVLDIRGARVTVPSVDELLRALPRCNVMTR